MHNSSRPLRSPDERLNDVFDRINAGERLRRHPEFRQAAVMVLEKANKRLGWWLSDQVDAEFRSIMDRNGIS